MADQASERAASRRLAGSRPAAAVPARQEQALPIVARFGSRRAKALLIAGGLALFVATGFIAALPFIGLSQHRMEQLGYPGLFITNFFSTALFFIPLPGLSAAGQALIVTLADRLEPVSVAIVGGLGMGLGELGPYVAGRGARTLSHGRDIPIHGRLGDWMRKVGGWIDRLMRSYGIPTLFVLSALPNPLFEVAGITAGATRMGMWRFLAPTVSGKLVRAFILAFAGASVLHLIH